MQASNSQGRSKVISSCRWHYFRGNSFSHKTWPWPCCQVELYIGKTMDLKDWIDLTGFQIFSRLFVPKCVNFSWEYGVKHVFLRWVVPELSFKLFQIHFFKIAEFLNRNIAPFLIDHISATTQHRKTCFTIWKFACSQLKNGIFQNKINWETRT